MKRYILILFIAVLFICGCDDISVPIDTASVQEFLKTVQVPEDVKFVSNDSNGIEVLRSIKENASQAESDTFVETKTFCILKGKYDGVWYYGYGTPEKLLMCSGRDKDSVYNLMTQYASYFAK